MWLKILSVAFSCFACAFSCFACAFNIYAYIHRRRYEKLLKDRDQDRNNETDNANR